jgi:hypothetical protein
LKTSSILRAGILMLGVSGSMNAVAELPARLVDPTRPLGDLTTWNVLQSGLILTSVMINKKTRVAVINGEQIVQGQKIGGAVVVSIQPGRVILQRGGRSEELKVHRYDVKRSATRQQVDKQSKMKSRL